MKLILASSSPRRKDLLTEFGFDFNIIKSDFNETAFYSSPKATVKNYALEKAKDVFNKLCENEKNNSVVLGADTVVVYKNKIIGKPKNKTCARETLKMLSGKSHYVYTGYCFFSGDKVVVKAVKSKVVFNTLSDSLIEDYLATNLPMDKAGCYGIQDGFPLVKRYKGSFNNIVGLPVEKFEKRLKRILKG